MLLIVLYLVLLVPKDSSSLCRRVLARFTSIPNVEHWNAMTQLMRYLKRTANYALLYQRYPAVLEGNSDASWNTLSIDYLSTTGYVFTLGNGAIYWKSKKQ